MAEYLEYRFKRNLKPKGQENYQHTIYNTYPIINHDNDHFKHHFINNEAIIETNETN